MAQFVYALLGSDYDDSPYTPSGERVAHLAVSGIRLVIDQFPRRRHQDAQLS